MAVIKRSTAGFWLPTLLIVLCAGELAAKERVLLKPGQIEHGPQLVRYSVGYRELFGAKVRQRLRSGFPITVAVRVFVYPARGGRPIAMSARQLRAVYDLWDEQYLLTIDDAEGRRQLALKSQQRLIDLLTSLWQFPVVRREELAPNESYFVGCLIEVNPVSPEVLAEVRRWLRKPYRRQRSATGESFFGSFVSIFVNDRVARAERVLKLRSQTFGRDP